MAGPPARCWPCYRWQACGCGAPSAAGLLLQHDHTTSCLPFALPCHALPTLACLQDLVDLAKPGDRITVTGVYRAMGVRTNPRLRELKVGGWVRWVNGFPCLGLPGWLAGGQAGCHAPCFSRHGNSGAQGGCTAIPLLPVPPDGPLRSPLSSPLPLPARCPLPASPQAVYKTYIDVVHIQKDEASNLFTMFAAEDSQGQTQATAAGEQLSQDTTQRNLADAPNTQVRGLGGRGWAGWGGGGRWVGDCRREGRRSACCRRTRMPLP